MYQVECSTICHAAHRIYGHSGKCKWLHGHSYVIKIRVSGETQSEDTGVVVDFSDLKKFVLSKIDDVLDHRVLLSSDDPLADVLIQEGQRVTKIRGSTSCENLAAQISHLAQRALEECIVASKTGPWISMVEVCESSSTAARVIHDKPCPASYGDFSLHPG